MTKTGNSRESIASLSSLVPDKPLEIVDLTRSRNGEYLRKSGKRPRIPATAEDVAAWHDMDVLANIDRLFDSLSDVGRRTAMDYLIARFR